MLTLRADIAQDLMTPGPVSIAENAGLEDAITFLTDKHFGAGLVIDVAGHPIGVVTKTDLLVHSHELLEDEDNLLTVKDVMTPAVFTVRAESSVQEVIDQMLELNVHHLFVTDAIGVVVGVISPLDFIRRLE